MSLIVRTEAILDEISQSKVTHAQSEEDSGHEYIENE